MSLFKLKYDLPYRVMEILFSYNHVTISRVVLRISKILSTFKFSFQSMGFVVDSTTIAIGRGKNKNTFSGYKHFHGIKIMRISSKFRLYVFCRELNFILCFVTINHFNISIQYRLRFIDFSMRYQSINSNRIILSGIFFIKI